MYFRSRATNQNELIDQLIVSAEQINRKSIRIGIEPMYDYQWNGAMSGNFRNLIRLIFILNKLPQFEWLYVKSIEMKMNFYSHYI